MTPYSPSLGRMKRSFARTARSSATFARDLKRAAEEVRDE